MSELKPYIGPNPTDHTLTEYNLTHPTDHTLTEYYLKSEADKVIADFEESHKKEVEQLLIEIVELKDIDSKNRSAYYKDLAMMAKDVEHHRYKRCLAMAGWCRARYSLWPICFSTAPTRKMKFLDKWEKRWLGLAEKFKEAK